MTFEPRTEINGTTRTYWTRGKSEWERGPWDNEPDKVQWIDEATGLPCLSVRNRIGTWCGYVGVPEGHKWYGKEYDEPDVEVHGGLTYSAACFEGPEGETICHVPEPGQSDKVWWLGFDCAHLGDATDFALPKEIRDRYADLKHAGKSTEVYRDLHYVKGEVANLAKQIQEAA